MLQAISEFDCYFVGRPTFESTPTLSQLSSAIRRTYFENKYFQREENKCLVSCVNGFLRVIPLRKDEGFESDSSFEDIRVHSRSLADSLSSGAHSGSDTDESTRVAEVASRDNEERRWDRLSKGIFNISDVIFCHVNNRSIVWVIREKQAKLCGLIFECVVEDAIKKLYENFTEERKALKNEQLRKKRDLPRSESILNRVSIREDRYEGSDSLLIDSPSVDKRRQPDPRDIIKKLERKSSFNVVRNSDGVMHIEISSGALSFPEDRQRFAEELNSKFRERQLSSPVGEGERRKVSSSSSNRSQDSSKYLPKKLQSPVADELEAVLRAQLQRRETPDSLSEERKLSVPEKEKPMITAAVRRAKSICRTERPKSRSRSRPRQRLPLDVEEISSLEPSPQPPSHHSVDSQLRHPLSRERGRSINRRGQEDPRRDPSQFHMRGMVPCVLGSMPPGYSGYPPAAIMIYPVPPPQGRFVPFIPSWHGEPQGPHYPPVRPWEDPGPRHPSEFSEVRNTKEFVEMRRRARSKSPARGRQALKALENAPEPRSFGNRIKDALGFKKSKAKADEVTVDTTDSFQPEICRKSIRKVPQTDCNVVCDNKKVTFNAFATVQLMEKR